MARKVNFINIWLESDTDRFNVDSSVESLDPDDARCVREGFTDDFVNRCAQMPLEKARAVQTMLLSFAAGLAAASGAPDENVEYFRRLVETQKPRYSVA